MLKFSTFQNRYAKIPIEHQFPFETFGLGMTTPIQKNAEEKDKLPLWSPTLFNGNRCKSNAGDVSCLVFDVDDGESAFDTWKLFHMWDVIAHTSFSHTPKHPKYRIILPLETPAPAAAWEKVWRRAIDIWEFVGAKGLPDLKALKDPARMYYRYALPKIGAEHHQAISSKGFYPLSIGWEQVVLPKKPTPRKIERDEKISQYEAIERTELREAIANRVSATISGNRAYKIPCPMCSRNSAYFFIDIFGHHAPQKGWKCNHANSCGGFGSLSELI